MIMYITFMIHYDTHLRLTKILYIYHQANTNFAFDYVSNDFFLFLLCSLSLKEFKGNIILQVMFIFSSYMRII